MKVMKVRFWVEMLGIVSLIACALALLIATLGGAAGAAADQPESARAAVPEQTSPAQSASEQSSSVQSSSTQSPSTQSLSTPASSTQAAAAEPQNYDGVITDTRCSAKHSSAIGQSAADCTRACVHGGQKFALVDGDKMYALEGEPEALKRAAGERVRIVGTLSGSTILVASVVTATP
jgi:hypothetical protein